MVGSLIVAMGLASYSGAPFTTAVMLVPYILLGVGVDDMVKHFYFFFACFFSRGLSAIGKNP